MPVLTADLVPVVVKMGASRRRLVEVAPRFTVGDRVVARTMNPIGHTRLPRYVRGKQGVIHEDYGVFGFPDTNAHGRGDNPQHVYNVRFSARELWGPTASEHDGLYIDLWEDYLDPA
jgi:nitrile hydratase